MEMFLAQSAGFCFGVKRAIDIAYQTADESNNKVYTLGPIIHNEQVINRLKELGINEIDSLDSITENSTVIIRTHGVAPEIYESLISSNIDFIDATCPFVKKIHKIVREYHNKGYKIIIFGDKNHPEVQGINGWCDYSAYIVENLSQIENSETSDKVCIVAQTTFSKEIWKKIKEFAKTSCKDVLLFDTICSATYERQKEAKEIAEKSDCMIVIGGRHSSNTKKLFDICAKLCPNTFHIETVSELPKSVLDRNAIGVTAGASTPEWIIKEVISIMSEEEKRVGELSFAEQLDESLVNPKTGDIITGTVISITPTEVYVDIGFKADGVIPLDQLTSDPDAKPEDLVTLGGEIEAFVYRVSDIEGTVGLSVKKLTSLAAKKKLEEALETREVLKGKVVDAVNGGVIVSYSEMRVFVPASQASVRFLKDLKSLVGQEVSFRIIEINQRRRKLIGSIKSVEEETRKLQLESFWSTAEIGKEYDGVVKSITDFGVFVDIGGVDGLVHISELSWGKIKHPSEVTSVGDTLRVFIISLNKETNKISLGFKRKEDNPWLKAQEMYNVGDVVNVKIVRLVAFGAFAELLPTVDGLIHISQISVERIIKPSSVLSIGQEVDAKITNIDWENKKISLSIRALIEPEEVVQDETEQDVQEVDVIEEIPQAAHEDAQEESESAPAEEIPTEESDSAPVEELSTEESLSE